MAWGPLLLCVLRWALEWESGGMDLADFTHLISGCETFGNAPTSPGLTRCAERYNHRSSSPLRMGESCRKTDLIGTSPPQRVQLEETVALNGPCLHSHPLPQTRPPPPCPVSVNTTTVPPWLKSSLTPLSASLPAGWLTPRWLHRQDTTIISLIHLGD